MAADLKTVQRRVIRRPGGMCEQMSNGDGIPIIRQPGEVTSDRIIQSQFALRLEHHDERGGELLGNRSNFKNRVGIDGSASFEVSHAITTRLPHMAMVENR